MPFNTLPSNAVSNLASNPPIELLGIEDAAEALISAVQSLDGVSSTGVASTFNVWDDLVSFTGSGVINYLAVELTANSSDVDLDVRVLIDSVEVFIRNVAWETSADATNGFAIIGLKFSTTAGVASESVLFNENFALQIRKSENTTGSATFSHWIKWSKE